MPRQPLAPVIGIIASMRGGMPLVPSEVQQAAQRRGIELRPVDAAPSGLFLGEAFSQFATWLILFSEDADTELLMVPYPDQFTDVDRNDESLRAADNLFEWIRTDRNSRWSAGKGHQNLVAAETRGRLPDSVRCFQVIRLPVRLREYLRGAIPSQAAVVSQPFADRIGHWFRAAAERVDEKRRVLRESLARVDSAEADHVRDSFDATLMAEATRIADHARGDRTVREPPLLAFLRHELGSRGLDPESIRFLETALLVEEMAIQVPGNRLDFSAAACPLWKIVELEMNLSVGWLVRLIRQVASDESGRIARPDRDPRDRVEVPTGREPYQRVELNERIADDVRRLKGLMLGPMQYLLAFAGENGIRDEILGRPLGGEWSRESLQTFLFDTRRRSRGSVQNAVRRISVLRNRHAHDTAMDRAEYDKLKTLVLGPTDESPAGSLNGRLVSLKLETQVLAARQAAHEPVVGS